MLTVAGREKANTVLARTKPGCLPLQPSPTFQVRRKAENRIIELLKARERDVKMPFRRILDFF